MAEGASKAFENYFGVGQDVSAVVDFAMKGVRSYVRAQPLLLGGQTSQDRMDCHFDGSTTLVFLLWRILALRPRKLHFFHTSKAFY